MKNNSIRKWALRAGRTSDLCHFNLVNTEYMIVACWIERGVLVSAVVHWSLCLKEVWRDMSLPRLFSFLGVVHKWLLGRIHKTLNLFQYDRPSQIYDLSLIIPLSEELSCMETVSISISLGDLWPVIQTKAPVDFSLMQSECLFTDRYRTHSRVGLHLFHEWPEFILKEIFAY